VSDYKVDQSGVGKELCRCGNVSTGFVLGVPSANLEPRYYCEKCDPDPPVDASNQCYVRGCNNHVVRSAYVGSGIELSVCEEHDDEDAEAMLGPDLDPFEDL